MNRIGWSSPVDLAPQYTGGGALLAHYGSPVITTQNTVVIPVKTGPTSGFRIEARNGTDGSLVWSQTSDYVMPAHNWVPSYNIALTPAGRAYAPGAGGKLLMRASPNEAAGAFTNVVFYGAAAYDANPAAFNATVFINTPITSDSAGTLFFGFVVTGSNPAGLQSGFARVDAAGNGSWVAAATVSGDATIAKCAMNCAPALSPDEGTVYIAVNNFPTTGTPAFGYLLALNSTTLALRNKVLLLDPNTGLRARIDDNGTSSPAVASDGRIFFGVLDNPFASHNARGWLLQFTATLANIGAPGSFGWDVTPSIIPAAMVPDYVTTSPYLIAVKYNNYEGIGTGTGANKLALLDPSQTQIDSIAGGTLTVMREVRTIVGTTFETGSTVAVKEWCINTMAADPFNNTIIANSEDGVLYRWHLPSNTFSQSIRITDGLGEAYTPTAIGADGTVYAIGNAKLFAVKA
ncbi:MAG: hypothetical protein H7255_10435 [Ramlibacter sp.]|nr:hypothetical protein [Ramlibacter sp.]